MYDPRYRNQTQFDLEELGVLLSCMESIALDDLKTRKTEPYTEADNTFSLNELSESAQMRLYQLTHFPFIHLLEHYWKILEEMVNDT